MVTVQAKVHLCDDLSWNKSFRRLSLVLVAAVGCRDVLFSLVLLAMPFRRKLSRLGKVAYGAVIGSSIVISAFVVFASTFTNVENSQPLDTHSLIPLFAPCLKGVERAERNLREKAA